MKFFLNLALLLLLLAPAFAWAESQMNPDLAALKLKAEQGDLEAQAKIGSLYYKGEGVEKDYKRALKWLRIPVQKNNPEAQNVIGVMYSFGHGLEQNYEKAFKMFEKSAKQGFVKAQRNLALTYMYGKGIKQNYKESFKWYKLAAEQDDVESQRYLGYLYFYGKGGDVNFEKAAQWNKKAAEQGNIDAQKFLGYQYEVGKGVEQNYQEAFKWYSKAVENSQDVEQYDLPTSYSPEDEIKKWAIEAVREIMTYNYQNYKERLKKNSLYFTEDGWISTSRALEKTGIIDIMTKDKLSLMSFQSDIAEVCNLEEKEDVRVWSVVVPIKTLYLSDVVKNKTSQTVLIFIEESKAGNKQVGQRAIGRWIGRANKPDQTCDLYEDVKSQDKDYEALRSKSLFGVLDQIGEIMKGAGSTK